MVPMLVRLLLVSETASFRTRIRRMVTDPHVLLIPRSIKKQKDLWNALGEQPFDLALVEKEALPERVGDLIVTIRELPERPEVIVINNREDSEESAELQAAGCYAVIYQGLSDSALGAAVNALIGRRRGTIVDRLRTERFKFKASLQDFVSSSPAMQTFMSMVYRVVPTDSSLLILGETGVGKERLARAIHNEGSRNKAPFITVNCAALPDALLESELFGHEEGAFTGAVRARRGHFELAHGGTLFLDEIGELPLHLQSKLLQVLQDRALRPIGSEKMVEVDVRIMAATNRDLEEEMEGKRFREDLYFRLSVVSLQVPPLRERRQDIPVLIDSYLEHFCTRFGWPLKRMDAEAREALLRYGWPGNVRELINVIERALILCQEEEITLQDLPGNLSGTSESRAGTEPLSGMGRIRTSDGGALLKKPWREARDAVLESFERSYLAGLLRETGGRIGETARRAGMSARSVHEKMKHHGLRKEDYQATR